MPCKATHKLHPSSVSRLAGRFMRPAFSLVLSTEFSGRLGCMDRERFERRYIRLLGKIFQNHAVW